MQRARQSGVTLIELTISIVVIAIAASAVLGVLSRSVEHSADAMIMSQAVSIGEAYLEEVALKPFADPDGTAAEAGRGSFDDVDDYNGLVDVGARDQFGAALPTLSRYTVAVTVASSAALTGVPGADAKRIDVRVTYAPNASVTLTAYRTRL